MGLAVRTEVEVLTAVQNLFEELKPVLKITGKIRIGQTADGIGLFATENIGWDEVTRVVLLICSPMCTKLCAGRTNSLPRKMVLLWRASFCDTRTFNIVCSRGQGGQRHGNTAPSLPKKDKINTTHTHNADVVLLMM